MHPAALAIRLLLVRADRLLPAAGSLPAATLDIICADTAGNPGGAD